MQIASVYRKLLRGVVGICLLLILLWNKRATRADKKCHIFCELFPLIDEILTEKLFCPPQYALEVKYCLLMLVKENQKREFDEFMECYYAGERRCMEEPEFWRLSGPTPTLNNVSRSGECPANYEIKLDAENENAKKGNSSIMFGGILFGLYGLSSYSVYRLNL